MEARKFVGVRKEEFNIKQFVKKMFGMGKVSRVEIEYTPVGEKIIVSTHKPGWIIGKRGEKINELTEVLKKRFKMENPHVDIDEIMHPEFDAQLVADDIATHLAHPFRLSDMNVNAIQPDLQVCIATLHGHHN